MNSLHSLLPEEVGDADKACGGGFINNKELKENCLEMYCFSLPLILLKSCVSIRECLIKLSLNDISRVCHFKEF